MTSHNRYTMVLDQHCSRVACTCGWKSDVIDDSKMGHANYYGIKDASDAYEQHLTARVWNYDAKMMSVTCPRCQYGFQVNLPEQDMSDMIAEMMTLLRKYGVA